MRDFLLDRAELAARKNIRDLIKYGDWMGFYRIGRPSEEPKVEQVLTSDEDRTRYAEALRESIRSEYPILTEEVMAPNPDYGRVQIECYDGPAATTRCSNVYAHE